MLMGITIAYPLWNLSLMPDDSKRVIRCGIYH